MALALSQRHTKSSKLSYLAKSNSQQGLLQASAPPKTFFENAVPSLAQSLFTVDLKKGAPGTLTFGAIAPSKYTGDITYVNVNKANGFWEFTSTGYAIGSTSFVSSSIDGIVDTGTTLYTSHRQSLKPTMPKYPVLYMIVLKEAIPFRVLLRYRLSSSVSERTGQ